MPLADFVRNCETLCAIVRSGRPMTESEAALAKEMGGYFRAPDK